MLQIEPICPQLQIPMLAQWAITGIQYVQAIFCKSGRYTQTCKSGHCKAGRNSYTTSTCYILWLNTHVHTNNYQNLLYTNIQRVKGNCQDEETLNYVSTSMHTFTEVFAFQAFSQWVAYMYMYIHVYSHMIFLRQWNQIYQDMFPLLYTKNYSDKIPYIHAYLFCFWLSLIKVVHVCTCTVCVV